MQIYYATFVDILLSKIADSRNIFELIYERIEIAELVVELRAGTLHLLDLSLYLIKRLHGAIEHRIHIGGKEPQWHADEEYVHDELENAPKERVATHGMEHAIVVACQFVGLLQKLFMARFIHAGIIT